MPLRKGLNLNRLSSAEAGMKPLPPLSGATAPAGEDIRTVVLASIEDMKAENTVEIDLAGKTSLADTMIVTSGRSDRHVGAIAPLVVRRAHFTGSGVAGRVGVENTL